jgi:hypothetical protein
MRRETVRSSDKSEARVVRAASLGRLRPDTGSREKGASFFIMIPLER